MRTRPPQPRGVAPQTKASPTLPNTTRPTIKTQASRKNRHRSRRAWRPSSSSAHPRGSAARISRSYRLDGVPETFVIDEQGVIRDKRIGPVDRTYIQDKLLPLAEDIRKTASCDT